jgi:hypothetical protein
MGALFAPNGTWQCPTLSNLRAKYRLDDPDFRADPWLASLPAEEREAMLARLDTFEALPAEMLDIGAVARSSSRTTRARCAGANGTRGSPVLPTHHDAALAQALAEEYSEHGVHVATVVVDGVIDSPGTRALPGLADRPNALISPLSIAEAFHYLHRQDPGCWTHELQLSASGVPSPAATSPGPSSDPSHPRPSRRLRCPTVPPATSPSPSPTSGRTPSSRPGPGRPSSTGTWGSATRPRATSTLRSCARSQATRGRRAGTTTR